MIYFNSDIPIVMGVLNVTPDSFSDGNYFFSPDLALRQALKLESEGATIIDIGGESTRPGAMVISTDEELSRIVPVIDLVKAHTSLKISIDTQKAAVMYEVLSMGVDMINDVNGLEDSGAVDVLKLSNCTICIMHKQGLPENMQASPKYNDVVDEVFSYLKSRVQACEKAGIQKHRLILDFGFGFGKTDQHNLALFNQFDKFIELKCALMCAVSRKSTIGRVLERPVNQRLAGSLALVAWAYLNGAKIFRVHDVQQTVDTLKILSLVTNPTRTKLRSTV